MQICVKKTHTEKVANNYEGTNKIRESGETICGGF